MLDNTHALLPVFYASRYPTDGELTSNQTFVSYQPSLQPLDLSAIASGDVSTDPENLRFQYPVEEASSKPASSRKAPAVYKEQVEASRSILPLSSVPP